VPKHFYITVNDIALIIVIISIVNLEWGINFYPKDTHFLDSSASRERKIKGWNKQANKEQKQLFPPQWHVIYQLTYRRAASLMVTTSAS